MSRPTPSPLGGTRKNVAKGVGVGVGHRSVDAHLPVEGEYGVVHLGARAKIQSAIPENNHRAAKNLMFSLALPGSLQTSATLVTE